MKSKRLSLGALALACALAALLGAARSEAAVALQSGVEGTTRSWRPDEGNILVGGQGRIWWTARGEAWELSLQGTWSQIPAMNLPVAVSDVRLLTDAVLLTLNGEVWHFAEGRWARADRFPL
jgi:hypothetical protein